jgi:SNF2 family DNA or RNA helicase
MFAKRLLPHAAARVLASGTPLAHSPLDVFAQFRAAAPAIFGPSYAAFKARYARLGGPDKKWIVGYQNTEDLERRMAPLTWRKTKAEALPYLPEQIDVEYTTELCPEAARIYREIERDMVAEFQGGKLTAANCRTKILRLQQLTGGAVPDDAGHHHQVDTGKRRLLQDTLEDLGDQPSVIFCRFRSDITAAHEACEAAGRKSLELSGTRNDLEAWQSGDLVHHVTDATGCSIPTVYSVLHGHSDDRPVRAAIDTYFRIRGIDPSGPMGIGDGHDLVVQIQSGSVGISLVRASVAIYYSLSSNLVEYDQSRSRIHRPGQKNACQYIYLTCQGTVDQKILKALRNRQDVIEEIMTLIAERARR